LPILSIILSKEVKMDNGKTSNLATRLKELLIEKRLTQKELLEKCLPYCKKYNQKIDKSYISKWIKGEYEPNQAKLTILGLDLNVSEVYLMGYDIPYIIGGSKTEAGKNRTIPIHSRILPIVRKFYINNDSDYLIKDITDKRIKTFLKNHNMSHCIHETRHTFRSELDRLNINKVTIDRLLGHANESIGEKVYTHKTLRELKEAIEQLRYK
jgi:transcriptional regulator with XRE-family HTH domain